MSTLKRRLAGLIVYLACMNVYATIGEGMYAGIMGGYATNNGANQQASVVLDSTGELVSVPVSPNRNQGAVRLYLGYKFNEWGGVEFGGTIYSVVNYNKPVSASQTTVQTGIATVDLMGVGTLPIWRYFDIFAKGGIAVVYQGTSRSIRPAPNQSMYQTSAKPIASIGFDYNLTQTWLVNVSATKVFTGGILKAVFLYALGFEYHNVDRFCGQFLCDD